MMTLMRYPVYVEIEEDEKNKAPTKGAFTITRISFVDGRCVAEIKAEADAQPE